MVAAVVALYLSGRVSRLLSAAIAGVAIVLALLMSDASFADLARAISRTGSVTEVTSMTGRTQIWAFAWEQIKESPLFGYGNASTKYYLPLKFHTFWGWTTTHFHNMWLQIWFTTGLIGVLLLLSIFLAQLAYWVRTRDALSLVFLGFAFVIGMAEAAFINGVPSVLTIVWLLWLAGPHNAASTTARVRVSEHGHGLRPCAPSGSFSTRRS